MIRVDQPRRFDLVGEQILIGGIAGGAFEASYVWRVGEGHDEATGYFMAGDGAGGYGQFQVTADVSTALFKNPVVYVDVFHTSAKDGSELELVRVPVYFGPVLHPGFECYSRHRVSTGDTLWKIAREFYGDGRLWRRLLVDDRLATEQTTLYPGDVVRVPR